MSWQAYVDTSLVGTGHIDRAAIFSAAGDSAWASSPGFNIQPAELQHVLASYKDAENPKKIQIEGFRMAGEKYMTLRAEDRGVYGRKGKEGIIIVKTKQALVVAHYPENVQPGSATTTVESLADYLINQGY